MSVKVVKVSMKKLMVMEEDFLNFACFRNMVICITMFEHKNVHKLTWRSPDGWYSYFNPDAFQAHVKLSGCYSFQRCRYRLRSLLGCFVNTK
jgi:hypothetical protein